MGSSLADSFKCALAWLRAAEPLGEGALFPASPMLRSPVLHIPHAALGSGLGSPGAPSQHAATALSPMQHGAAVPALRAAPCSPLQHWPVPCRPLCHCWAAGAYTGSGQTQQRSDAASYLHCIAAAVAAVQHCSIAALRIKTARGWRRSEGGSDCSAHLSAAAVGRCGRLTADVLTCWRLTADVLTADG